MFLLGLLQPEVVVSQSRTAGMAAPLSSSPMTSNMPCTHPSSHNKTVDFLDDNSPASISLPSPFLTIKTKTWSNFFQTSAPWSMHHLRRWPCYREAQGWFWGKSPKHFVASQGGHEEGGFHSTVRTSSDPVSFTLMSCCALMGALKHFASTDFAVHLSGVHYIKSQSNGWIHSWIA